MAVEERCRRSGHVRHLRVVDFGGKEPRGTAIVERMTGTLSHRGPDDRRVKLFVGDRRPHTPRFL